MSWRGMNGHMGYSSDESPITIELIKLWNKLGEECGWIYSEQTEMPEHLSKLNDAINSIRKYIKENN